jgi:hypothetical protein
VRSSLRLVVAVAVVVLGGGGWLLHHRHGHTRPAFAWPERQLLRYTLRWSKQDAAAVPAAARALAGDFTLAGQLTMRGAGRDNGRWLVGVRLERVDEARFTVDGHEVIDAAARSELTRPEALFAIAPTGMIEAILLPPDAGELWKSTLQSLASELEVVIAGESSWTVAQHDPLGVVEIAYRKSGDDRLERRRAHYSELRLVEPASAARAAQSIVDDGRVTLADGHLASLEDARHVSIAVDGQTRLDQHAELSLTLTAVTRSEPTPPLVISSLESRVVGQPVVTSSLRQRLLRQRAGTLTSAALLAGLAQPLGVRGDAAWMWRASGLVALEPGLCARLAERFSATASAAERALILDLLASAGSHEAQAAMRAALASGAARQDPAFGLLVQRFSAVATPESASAAFLADGYRAAAAPDVARANLFALGSTTGRLADSDDVRRFNRVLVDAVRAADAPADRAAALRALGNAGLPEDVPLALAEVHADDVAVRAAATAALRHVVTAETTAALIDGAADPAQPVGAEALQALAGRDLGDAELDKLAAAVDSASRSNDALLVNIAAARLASSPEAATLLEKILARSDDPSLQARIRTLLNRVGRAS